MRFSVVIPTYRRPEVLRTCLAALARQTVQPDEVLIVRRANDDLTAELVQEEIVKRSYTHEVLVGSEDNFALALNAGIMASTGDFVALTDDDAEASADWIERLVERFTDPRIAGVGGRDVQIQNPGHAKVVGILKWYGKVVGNHHIGVGQPRDVDVLKGVNCCFRGELVRAIGIDERLHGAGTVMHTELSLCLPLRRAGFRLVYDPTLIVLHHIAPRGDGDNNNRGGFSGPALRDITYNETLVILEHLPWFRKVLFLSWGFLIGSLGAPGLLQIPRAIGKFGRVREVFARWQYALVGRCSAIGELLFQRTKAPCDVVRTNMSRVERNPAIG